MLSESALSRVPVAARLRRSLPAAHPPAGATRPSFPKLEAMLIDIKEEQEVLPAAQSGASPDNAMGFVSQHFFEHWMRILHTG